MLDPSLLSAHYWVNWRRLLWGRNFPNPTQRFSSLLLLRQTASSQYGGEGEQRGGVLSLALLTSDLSSCCKWRMLLRLSPSPSPRTVLLGVLISAFSWPAYHPLSCCFLLEGFCTICFAWEALGHILESADLDLLDLWFRWKLILYFLCSLCKIPRR